jgi:hypothetical protein
LALVILFCGATASADSEGERRAAHLAIRAVVRENSAGLQAVFTETKSQFLSLTESRITGKGYLSSRGQWNVQSFSYSVKVRRSNYQTRDAEVTLANGAKWTSEGDWEEIAGDYIGYFTNPAQFTNFPTSTARFEGVASIPRVGIRVYDRNNRLIQEKQIVVANGRFSTSFTLPNGTYRAVLGFARMSDADEVRFSIRTSGDDWGLLTGPSFAEKIAITQPRNNSNIDGIRAVVQGTSSANEVRVVVYDSGNRVVSQQNIRVRDGRWNTSLSLPAGRYRVLAKTLSGRGQAEVTFNYKSGSSGTGNESLVTISAPRDNAVVNAATVAIQGTSREADVDVKVYNTRGNVLVANHSVVVRNGRWSVTLRNLPNGTFRVVVVSGSGRDTDEVTFRKASVSSAATR